MNTITVIDNELQDLALPSLAKRINAAIIEAEGHARSAMDTALTAGALLIEAKQQVAHGEWENWLASNCQVAPRTAQSYMRLFKQLPLLEDSKAQRVADLPLREVMRAIATDPAKPSQPRYTDVRLAKKDDAERAVTALNKSAAALKAAAKNVNSWRELKDAQIVSLRKKLTDALEAIDHMEADSAKAKESGAA